MKHSRFSTQRPAPSRGWRGCTWRSVGLIVLFGSIPALIAGQSEPLVGETTASRVKPSEPGWPDVGQDAGYNQRASLIQRGRQVYQDYCIGCHGEYGDGHGPAAVRLITKPRDFTKGVYKFRSTDSGSLPMETDLHRTITRGLSRVSMPAFALMSERDKLSVIEYIKSFYPQWEQEKPKRKKVFIPQAPEDLNHPDRAMRGRIVYIAMQCGKCHGADGAGAGATQTQYTDAWGNPQKAFDFTLGRLKGGDDPEDIYRTFHTGLRSVMPSYGGVTLASVNRETFESQSAFLEEGEAQRLAAVLEQYPQTATEVFAEMDDQQRQELVERNSWDLVAFVRSLRRTTASKQTDTAPADTTTPSGPR